FLEPADDSGALTVTGAILGTPDYMAPEQIRGGTPRPSWDLWALAVVAYEILAGCRPFADPSPGYTPREHGLVTQPLSALSPPLDVFFAAAFAPDPEKRPSSALAFIDELERALQG